jgi:hypothetical protein
MNTRFSTKFFSMSLALTVLLQMLSLYPGQAAPRKKALKFVAPLSQRPYPGQRSPGAGKGTCPPAAAPLTILTPRIARGNTFDTWGQTTQERPLIWVYVPYGSQDKLPENRKNQFEVVLEIGEDAPGQTMTKVSIPLPEQAKIMPISLPPDYKLEVGKNYQVLISSTCNLQQASFWVQRVTSPPEITNVSSSRDRLNMLAERGIWLDTLTEVVKVNAAPKLSAEWRSFVQASLGWDLQESTPTGQEENQKMEKILDGLID